MQSIVKFIINNKLLKNVIINIFLLHVYVNINICIDYASHTSRNKRTYIHFCIEKYYIEHCWMVSIDSVATTASFGLLFLSCTKGFQILSWVGINIPVVLSNTYSLGLSGNRYQNTVEFCKVNIQQFLP